MFYGINPKPVAQIGLGEIPQWSGIPYQSDFADLFQTGGVIDDMPANRHSMRDRDVRLTASEFVLTPAHARRLDKQGARHKYDHGHAVIVSGAPGQGGAARLAAKGALRVGAGLVSVFCEAASRAEHAAHLDAIMVKPFEDTAGFASRLQALRASAVCIGPNLGLGGQTELRLAQTLALGVPVCLDADALTLVSREADLEGKVVQAQTIMTPHEGELRRLIPDAFDHTSCRVTLAKTAAQKFRSVVLFKGAHTIVAHPDGACRLVDTTKSDHASWLATAGSGDVLAGMITGLMARGFDPFEAACIGAQLHVHCAAVIGPGLIASDIPDALPRVLSGIIATQD